MAQMLPLFTSTGFCEGGGACHMAACKHSFTKRVTVNRVQCGRRYKFDSLSSSPPEKYLKPYIGLYKCY